MVDGGAHSVAWVFVGSCPVECCAFNVVGCPAVVEQQVVPCCRSVEFRACAFVVATCVVQCGCGVGVVDGAARWLWFRYEHLNEPVGCLGDFYLADRVVLFPFVGTAVWVDCWCDDDLCVDGTDVYASAEQPACTVADVGVVVGECVQHVQPT